MAQMTEEEAWALDDKWTKSPPNVGQNGTGFLSRLKDEGRSLHFVEKDHVIILDDLSSAYIHAQAEAANTTPTVIIGKWVRQSICKAAAL